MTIESDHYGQQALVLQRTREHERAYPPAYLYSPPVEPPKPQVSVGRVIGGTLAASMLLVTSYYCVSEICKPVERKLSFVAPAHMFKNYRKGNSK